MGSQLSGALLKARTPTSSSLQKAESKIYFVTSVSHGIVR
jgi:hypothetical protein